MEYTALYRKFRPMKFSEVVGQEHIIRTLINQVKNEKVGHAYLFTGCRGCGKTTSAKILARAINCLNPKDGEPDNSCEICKNSIDGTLTDIVEMDAASNNGVDDIRQIRDEVNFLPTKAKYRIYIIDEVHMLSPGAFNALLKTLEEPPKHVKFILCTTDPQKLPATILSRCQRFDFKKINNNEIEKNLEDICNKSNISFSQNALKLIAELSEGAMRDAISILERCAQDDTGEVTVEKITELVGIPKQEFTESLFQKIINGEPENVLDQTENEMKQGKDATNIIWELIKYSKDILLYKTTNKISNIYNEKSIENIKEKSNSIESKRLLNIIFELSKLQNDIKWSTQKNIVVQAKLLEMSINHAESDDERISKLEDEIEKIKENGIEIRVEKTKKNKNEENIVKEKISKEVKINSNIENNVSTNIEEKVEKGNKEKIETKSNEFIKWSKVIDELISEGKVAIIPFLKGTKAIILDDMTIGIELNKANSIMAKTMLGQLDNINEITRLTSIECGKPMRIIFIDNNEKKSTSDNGINKLDVEINFLDN